VSRWQAATATPPALERQHAARTVYRKSVGAGEPVSGAELGRRVDRSPRWGLGRIAEVQAEDNPDVDPARHQRRPAPALGQHNRQILTEKPLHTAAPVPAIVARRQRSA
jgi:hypothetical protein